MALGFLAIGTFSQIDGTRAWGASETLRITAAADLMPVLPALIREFTKKTHVAVRVSYGSSGEAAIAIRHRAPFDLFLSADAAFPEKLSRQGWVQKDSVKSYAKGILVLWVSQKSLAAGTKPLPDLSSLTGTPVKKIAIANPRLAPYGRAAMVCMKSRKLWVSLRQKVVYGNSLAQVAQYLRTKTADAGFLSKAQAMVLSRHASGDFVDLSPACVPLLEQKMAIVKGSSHLKSARAFEDFMLGNEARNFLKSHGYRE
jgi:molybdate transport system substrate-binding protein